MSKSDWIPRRFLVDNRGKPHDDSEVSLCTSCGVVVWNWKAHMRHLHGDLTKDADLGTGSDASLRRASDPAQAAPSTGTDTCPTCGGAPHGTPNILLDAPSQETSS